MSFYIGNVEIKNKVVLAPMAGYTNEAFFYLAKKFGAGLLFSEMISDKGILYHNEKTLSLLRFDKSLHPFAIQLFGNDPIELGKAAKEVYEIANPDIIDINMGCSVPKIFNNGSGAALMKNPELVFNIVQEVVRQIPIPVTIKIRSGLTHNSINCLEIAKAAERAGCSAITIHPRTKSDLFKESADWSLIKLLKDNLKIPVIGSGDVKCPNDAKKMLDETGCDAVMVGRAALGNPFIFKEINDFLKTGNCSEPSLNERFDIMSEHFSHLVELDGEKSAVLLMRSLAPYYVKGMKNASSFKVKLDLIDSSKEFLDLVAEYRNKICDI